MKEKVEIKCLENDLVIRYANNVSGFFGHPCYLVGSQLTKDNPRDVDLLIIIPDEEFVLRYINQHDAIGENDRQKCVQWGLRHINGLYNESNWKWAKDISHKSLQGMRFARAYIDLKVYPQSYQDDYHKDDLKLKISED